MERRWRRIAGALAESGIERGEITRDDADAVYRRIRERMAEGRGR